MISFLNKAWPERIEKIVILHILCEFPSLIESFMLGLLIIFFVEPLYHKVH